MIFQLNITTTYRYNDYVEEVSGSFRSIRQFVGDNEGLESELKDYEGIELIRFPTENNHAPYITIELQVTVV